MASMWSVQVRSNSLPLLSTATPSSCKIARIGDVLGLSATLNDLPHEVTAETLSPCNFKHIGQHLFLSFLQEHAEAGYTAALTLTKNTAT